ncbi:MAG TPA: putative toxin-antitoxin system toxin component, PIN family [Longimicrobiales bacterium]|nr:putative toxin-antitoxin system toxin component, PIN family [Longimicrobiales bacterium]
MHIVLDTNVIVSALLVQGSVPDQVLDTVISGRSTLLIDGRIMQEYRSVLQRPEFGFPPELVADLLVLIAASEWVLPEPLPLDIPDPDDLPFLEVAVAGGADALVTGNVRDFRLRHGTLDLLVLTPRQYIDRVAGRTPR